MLAVQPDGKILVAGQFTMLAGQTRKWIGRLNPDGTLDSNFTPGIDAPVAAPRSLAIQTDGKILVAGYMMLGGQTTNCIARLNSDGTLDPEFNTATEAYSSVIRSLTVQPDGKILVGGTFRSLAGQSRTNIGRLNSTEAAAQSLGYADPTITWLRSGASPEFWRTTFEISTNGLTFSNVGEGSRIAGGWQLTGVSFPVSSTIRARGHVAGAHYQGSGGWFTETFGGGPFLVESPTSQVKEAGTTAMFNVFAVGSETLNYQWRFFGTNIPAQTGTNLILAGLTTNQAGPYQVVVSNVYGSVTSAVASLTVMSIAEALDAPQLLWTLGGTTNWIVQATNTYDGVDAAQSGAISHGQETWMETTVVGPGLLTFWWMVSSESYSDYLEFFTNGVRVVRISGDQNWQMQIHTLRAGTNALRWRYTKDSYGSSGQDRGWVDQVVFASQSGPPVIAIQPTNQSVEAGETCIFAVTAGGALPLTYQWQFLGANLAGQTSTNLVLSGVTTNQTGAYSVVVTNALGSVTSAVATLTVVPVLTLGEALDAPELTWTTGGNAPWKAQTTTTHDGVDAAQSGAISHTQETWLQTSVVGPGPLTFWWKVSSESGYDYLEFYTNSVRATRISGEVAWQQVNCTLGAGTHTLRWRYMKDSSASSGQDRGWVDQVSFAPVIARPVITVNDSSFGIRTNRFGFNVSGPAGQVVVVEGSTNLLNWQSLQTNTLGSGPFYFSDPSTGTWPRRFYRVRVNP
ncbi:MAG TPA: immunoglobulin domain-containing protein [Verrucomicrobiae bacterium]